MRPVYLLIILFVCFVLIGSEQTAKPISKSALKSKLRKTENDTNLVAKSAFLKTKSKLAYRAKSTPKFIFVKGKSNSNSKMNESPQITETTNKTTPVGKAKLKKASVKSKAKQKAKSKSKVMRKARIGKTIAKSTIKFQRQNVPPVVKTGPSIDEQLLPSLVSVTYIKIHICTGSILTTNLILTVAHCLFDGMNNPLPKENFEILVGFRSRKNATPYKVQGFLAHDNYDNQTFSNDIGLIKTTMAIVLGPTVTILPLKPTKIQDKTLIEYGTTCWYGKPVNDTSYHKETFNFAHVRSIPIQSCKETFPGISIRHICMSSVATRGSCNEDFGGPLVMQSDHGLEQAGILTFSINCGVEKPEVYTRISWYYNWIQNHVMKLQQT